VKEKLTFDYHPGPSARCALIGADYHRELHCGDCFKLIAGNLVHEVRIEFGMGDWYLVGVTPSAASRWDGTPAERYR